MKPRQPTAQKWTCDECGVTTSRLDEKPATEPIGWTNSGKGLFCLACRRSHAAEAALSRVPSGTPRDDCRRIRRTALIEFEMRRTPEHGDGRIASACGTSPVAVAAVRRVLDTADSLPVAESQSDPKR
jgi:hypothetical protein